MPDVPQPATGYDTALGTLQQIFENKAKGLYPSNYIDQTKYIARHFAKHLKKIRADPKDRLTFLGKLRAVTKGSRGYLDDEGNRPADLTKPDAGWYLSYTQHVALGHDALGAYNGETPAYEGGTWCFNYRHKDSAGKIVEDTVRCTFETNQREWMHFESKGMTSMFHFSRGEDAPEGCWLGCDGFFAYPTRPDGGYRQWALCKDEPRAIARFHSVARPVSYDLVVYDDENPYHLVWAYDAKGKAFNANMYRITESGNSGNGPFCPYNMIAIDVFNICHDGVEAKTDLADETIHFDDFEDTNQTEKSMWPLLKAKAKADKKRLDVAFREWVHSINVGTATDTGTDPARAAKRLRVDLAAYKEDGF